MPRTGVFEILGYVPAELHVTPKGLWYIDYYVRHPKSGERVRRINRLTRVPGGKRRETVARQMIHELNKKLERGWNPLVQSDVVFGGTTMAEALQKWDAAKERQLRHSSPVTYASFTDIFRKWCDREGILNNYVYTFNRNHAIAFYSYVSDDRLVGNATYNNYLVFFTMLWKWLIERGFTTQNPFSGFSRRKEVQKTRTYLTVEDRLEMARWIHHNDPNLWLACVFIYGTLIRPAELRRLRVHHVDLERQVVTLPAEDTKSGIERHSAIPDWMAKELYAMGLHKQPGKHWLLGRKLVPGEKPIARNTLRNHWLRMRDALHWPESKQLYSLRDTGIIQLIRDGVDLLAVRQQAGHTDLATTNAYVKHAFPEGPVEVKAKGTRLQASSPLIVAQPFLPDHDHTHKEAPRFAQMERNDIHRFGKKGY